MSIPTVQPLATQNVLIQGHRVAYGVFGSGKPVVLLHGTPSSSLIWRNIIPPLVSAGYQTHIFDLLGYGLSERPWNPNVDTSITGQVTILEHLLSHWNLQSIHLVAHDIGGAVAQRFAIFNPDRILTLTMMDVVSFDSYPSTRTKRQMQAGLGVLSRADDTSHKDHFKQWLLSAVHNRQRVGDTGILDVYLEYISGPLGQPSLFQHQIRHYDPKHTMEIAHRYHELGRHPVKLVWGAEDAWQRLEWAEKLKNAIPGSDLDVVGDAGHFSLEDQPEKIANLLIGFLDRYS